MTLKYEFETKWVGYSEKYDEEYWETKTYEYEISSKQEKEVAVEIILNDIGGDRESATKFVEKILWEYDLLESFLEDNIDYVTEYFEDEAKDSFDYDMR